ncbi:MAG: hypothetical protein NTZ39_11125, partial [Methanoregula sp.]|nr:hypothetical protein [Methanoregula sp.]
GRVCPTGIIFFAISYGWGDSYLICSWCDWEKRLKLSMIILGGRECQLEEFPAKLFWEKSGEADYQLS